MPTKIAYLFSEGRFEEVLRETAGFLRTSPGHLGAIRLRAQAHYHLGEYFAGAELLGNALAFHVAAAPLATRVQLAALLAQTLLQQGEYADAIDLAERTVPAGASPEEMYGELLLAAAWAAFFDGRVADAARLAERVFEHAQEPFTCGRAALVAALAARHAGEQPRSTGYLVKAHHLLAEAEHTFGNPEPVRTLYLTEVEIARHGTSDRLLQALDEAGRMPPESKVAAFVRETVDLYRRFLGKEPVAPAVAAAIGQGVKRTWLALLPGASATQEVGATESVASATDGATGSGEGSSSLREIRVRRAEDSTTIRRRKSPAASILHVEPDDAAAASLAQLIADTAYSVAGRVRDLSELLATFLEARPGLVALDLGTPGEAIARKSGTVAAVNQLLKVDREAKILLTYGGGEDERVLMAALQAGARAQVRKPFVKAELVRALQKAATARAGTGLELRRTLACQFKPVESGVSAFLKPWRSAVGRALDARGMEISHGESMRRGDVVRLEVTLPEFKPLHALAEVTSCKADVGSKSYTVRLTFMRLPDEARRGLEAYLARAAVLE